VFVSDAHEHIVPIPEDRPAILLLDVGGLNLVLVLELVAANVYAIRVQLEPLLIFSVWLVRWPMGRARREMRELRASVRPEAADSGLHRSTPLRSEVFGGGDQRLEHLQGR
jgi:hypothetical protein